MHSYRKRQLNAFSKFARAAITCHRPRRALASAPPTAVRLPTRSSTERHRAMHAARRSLRAVAFVRHCSASAAKPSASAAASNKPITGAIGR